LLIANKPGLNTISTHSSWVFGQEDVLLGYLDNYPLNDPKDWQISILKKISKWPLQKNQTNSKRSKYLIFGEALDWKLLAEKVSIKGCGKASDKLQSWLDLSDPMGGFNELQFKRYVGLEKYRAVLSFFYGVTVERALVIDIQELFFKRLIGNGKHPNETFCDGLYVELYGKTQDELWTDFTETTEANNVLKGRDHFLFEDNIFTYWLFKLRMSFSEPEKLASDTRRGLQRLSKIQNSHMKRLSNKFLNRE